VNPGAARRSHDSGEFTRRFETGMQTSRAIPLEIASGESCHYCGARSSTAVLREAPVRLLQCTECKLVFAAQFADLAQMIEFYESYYSNDDLVFHPLNEKRIHEILARVEARVGVGRVLDIGCGSGHLLQAARSRGWQVCGIEISASALQHLQTLGIDAFAGDLLDAQFPPDSFDLIYLSEVIEHVLTPRQWLGEIRRILKPKGLLLLTTPNRNSLTRFLLGGRWRVFRHDHVNYFTPSFLQRALQREGFRISRLGTKNMDLSEIYQKLVRRSTADSGTIRKQQQELRSRIERSRVLDMGKKALNRWLRATGLGDTIEVEACKPPRD
jgi:SAM-dependent methyltransferase